MSKFLNVFNTLAEYQAFSASTEYVQPNVALVKETNVLYYDYGDNKPQADMSNLKVESQETSVGGNKYGKEAITKINYIPNGITSLQDEFREWKSLEEVTCEIPSSVTNLNNTFNGCESLVTVTAIPNSVTNLSYTFEGCNSLVTAPEIPNSVKNMYATFQNCSNLISVSNIPSGITNISWTFNYCSSLKELTFLMITPPTYSSTLQCCSKLESIYVPDESVDTYKTATGWSEFADKLKPLSSKPTE